MAFIHALPLGSDSVLRPFHTKYPTTSNAQIIPVMSATVSRRTLLRHLSMVPIALSHIIQPASAAMYSSDTTPAFTTTGDQSKLSTYLPQIEEGYKTLLSLRDNWDNKTATYDGDIVRRDLGTVGLKSPLFNIRKVLFKAWQIIAEASQDDALIERLESEWNDVVTGISSVDFQLYSVSFTELTESKESLLKQGRAALDDLISIYSSMLDDFHSVS